jgi:hypothetical protein
MHILACLTTSLYSLTKRVLHRVQCSAFGFNFPYPFFALMSSNSCLYLIPPLLITFLPSSIFTPLKCLSMQFLRQMWRIHLICLRFIICKILLFALTLLLYFFISHTTSPTDLHPLLISHFEICQVFLIYSPKCPICSTIHLSSKYSTSFIFSLSLSKICCWKISSSCWILFYPWNVPFYFTCIICYTIDICEMFHVFLLCWIYHGFL